MPFLSSCKIGSYNAVLTCLDSVSRAAWLRTNKDFLNNQFKIINLNAVITINRRHLQHFHLYSQDIKALSFQGLILDRVVIIFQPVYYQFFQTKPDLQYSPSKFYNIKGKPKKQPVHKIAIPISFKLQFQLQSRFHVYTSNASILNVSRSKFGYLENTGTLKIHIL